MKFVCFCEAFLIVCYSARLVFVVQIRKEEIRVLFTWLLSFKLTKYGSPLFRRRTLLTTMH